MKLVIILISLLFCNPLFFEAQEANLKIVVTSNGEILPYANIVLNGKHYCLTDLNGEAVISGTSLAAGDTITVSYIGMQIASVICDKQNMSASKMIIQLDNTINYEIDPLIVKADFNHWKFFKKNTVSANAVMTNCIVNGNFEFHIAGNSDVMNGSFILNNTIPLKTKDFFKYYFSELPIIKSTDAAITDDIRKIITQSISTSCQIISRINAERYSDYKYSEITYLGIKNGLRLFRIVYTNRDLQKKLSFQILAFVNLKTNQIASCEYAVPLFVGKPIPATRRSSYKIDYKEYTPKDGKTTYMIPDKIEIHDVSANKQPVTIFLSSIEFQVFK